MGHRPGLIDAILDVICSCGVVFIAGDETVTKHPERKVYGTGKHRDAKRSTNSFMAYLWRHEHRPEAGRVLLSNLVKLPGTKWPWALPILTALYRSSEESLRLKRQLLAVRAALVSDKTGRLFGRWWLRQSPHNEVRRFKNEYVCGLDGPHGRRETTIRELVLDHIAIEARRRDHLAKVRRTLKAVSACQMSLQSSDLTAAGEAIYRDALVGEELSLADYRASKAEYRAPCSSRMASNEPHGSTNYAPRLPL